MDGSRTEVILPKWGVTMQEASINEWYTAIGESVSEGQALVSVGTDKVDADVEAPVSGVLTEISVEAGVSVPVGTVLGIITGS
jgi:pyruvate dehydrogenase E2 component (dihydrolipoamide acetyltransferase)